MKKNLLIAFVLFAIVGAIVDCGSAGSGSSGTPSGTPVVSTILDKAVVDQVAGIPECDEVLKMIAEEANIPGTNDAATTSKTTFLNKIKESIKRSVDESKGDKPELAKNCKAFKYQVDRYKMLDGEKR